MTSWSKRLDFQCIPCCSSGLPLCWAWLRGGAPSRAYPGCHLHQAPGLSHLSQAAASFCERSVQERHTGARGGTEDCSRGSKVTSQLTEPHPSPEPPDVQSKSSWGDNGYLGGRMAARPKVLDDSSGNSRPLLEHGP